ncbi:hypothetical protein [Halobacillus litoralis]|nr:hypothetical protein [Halobacillus litoralis]MCA1021580.1 hypothetical protein [Halobacillus litoralis]
MKKTLCALTGHMLNYCSIEEKKDGSRDYRYVNTCKCGEKKDVSPWTHE